MRGLKHVPAEPPLAGMWAGESNPPLLLSRAHVLIKEDDREAIAHQEGLNPSAIASSIGDHSGTELIAT